MGTLSKREAEQTEALQRQKFLSIPRKVVSSFTRRMKDLVRVRKVDVNIPVCVAITWRRYMQCELDNELVEYNIARNAKVRKYMADYNKDLKKFDNDIVKLSRQYMIDYDYLFNSIEEEMYSRYPSSRRW